MVKYRVSKYRMLFASPQYSRRRTEGREEKTFNPVLISSPFVSRLSSISPPSRCGFSFFFSFLSGIISCDLKFLYITFSRALGSVVMKIVRRNMEPETSRMYLLTRDGSAMHAYASSDRKQPCDVSKIRKLLVRGVEP